MTEFKRKNRDQPLSIETSCILRDYQNLREDLSCLLSENFKFTLDKVNLPKEISSKLQKNIEIGIPEIETAQNIVKENDVER